ncbi:MAG: efflux RND transporter periplasmic adaptor subunit [bacterium]
MRFKLLNILLIIFVTVSFSGCWFKKDDNSLSSGKHKQIILNPEQEKNARIQTEILKKRDLQMVITIPAQFKAMNKFLDRIYAPINGKVTNVFVDFGQVVKKGQALIEIKSDEIGQIQLEFLDRYIQIDSDVKQMNAMYELSQQNYNREATLFKEGVSSRMEYDIAKAQMRKDKASFDSLKIERSTLKTVYAQRIALYGGSGSLINAAIATKHIYPFITLRAAKNGVILERKINPGEIVEKDRELFNIADLSTIWLVGYAFEKDSQFLKIGQQVSGILEETKGKEVQGILSYVSPILDSQTKTLEVHADIENKDFSIKPNMYAEMNVNIGNINALAVPNSALEKYGDYTFAYVKVKPNTYEERKVQIGQKNETYSEVLSGLQLGEKVVTEGEFSLLGESIKQREK